MARGKRKQVVKEEKVVEQVEEVEKVESAEVASDTDKKEEQTVVEEKPVEVVEEKKKEESVPKNLNEYVQKQLKEQQERIAEQQKHKATIVRKEDGTIAIAGNKPPVPKGKLLQNTLVSNSITGWQRTLLQGMEVEIVADLGSKVTIRAYGMLHTISAKYVEKL